MWHELIEPTDLFLIDAFAAAAAAGSMNAARRSSPLAGRGELGAIVDVWMQTPTRPFLTDDIFKSLHRWNRTSLEALEEDDNPVYDSSTTVASMDAGGVERGLICSWYGPQGPLISNNQVLAACTAHPGRLLGVASADIRHPVEAVQEVRQRVVQDGFVAVRVLPWLWERYANDALFYPIYAECVQLGVPLCLQVGQTGPLRPSDFGRPIPYLERVLLDFPDLTVVGGHIGDPWIREMIFLCGKFPNLFIDTSAYTPQRYPPELVDFLKSERGRKRVMYGSNFPMIQHVKIRDELDKLGLDSEGMALFLRGNAERVFKLKAEPPGRQNSRL